MSTTMITIEAIQRALRRLRSAPYAERDAIAALEEAQLQRLLQGA